MVTYLKTLIYIQDASCAGLRVWLAISGIFAGFRFLSASSGFSFVRPAVSEQCYGMEKRLAEGEGSGREIGRIPSISVTQWELDCGSTSVEMPGGKVV